MLLSTTIINAQENHRLNVLVFSKTAGFRHASIPAGIKAIFELGQKQNWCVTATEDATMFNDEVLSKVDVCVWLNSTENVLDDAQQEAFTRFIRKGRGFVGIHGASDCEYDWNWYGNLVGGWFKTHPPYQVATINIESTDHPAMEPFRGMKTYTTEDEWYTFKANPRGKVTVLATLDENSIQNKPDNDGWKMGDHPVIWFHEYEGARAFYTVFGHADNAFQNELIVRHMSNAIEWAGRKIDF